MVRIKCIQLRYDPQLQNVHLFLTALYKKNLFNFLIQVVTHKRYTVKETKIQIYFVRTNGLFI